MLSISHMSLHGERYYLTLSTEDYYLNGGEPEGRWLGSGKEQLGLSGTVLPEQLKALFQGFDTNGNALVRNAGKTTGKLRRKPGWDLTFSVPKSVSVLWSQLDAASRRKIQDAHAAAVERALQYLEDTATFSRRGKGGSERITAKLVVASFEHGTSRALEPQLHTHCLLLNLGICEDGRVRSLVSPPFYENKMLVGAIYRLELGYQLTRRLGLEVERKKSWFEVVGVSPPLIDRYSTRRKQIEELLGQFGIDTASAAAFANRKTRKLKDVVPPRSELFLGWQHDGRALAFGPQEAHRLLATCSTRKCAQKLVQSAVRQSVSTLASHRSYVTVKDLLLETAHQLQASGVRPDELLNHFPHEVTRVPGLRNLGVRNNEQYLATEKSLLAEKELLRALTTLSERQIKPIPEKQIARLFSAPILVADHSGAQKPLRLSDEQQKAVRHLVLGDSPIRVVTGLAGTGKTAMLAATRKAFESSGYHVIGFAPTHRARQELSRGAGIESDTIRMRLLQINPATGYLVRHHARQFLRAAKGKRTFRPDRLELSHKSVLIVDEASMVRTQDMQQLLSAVVERGGRMLVIGDDRQLPPVGLGGAFGALISRLGSVDLTEVTRQKKPWAKEATQAIAAGNAEGFLKAYAAHGCLNVEKTQHDLEQSLIADWTQAGGCYEPEKHIIAASTNGQVDAYNKAAQEQRLQSGQLNARHTLTLGDETFHVGDRITFQKNSRRLNVYNGDTGTVLGVKDWGWTQALAVRVDRPEQTLSAKAKEFAKHTAVQMLRQAAGRKTYRYQPNDYNVRIIPVRTFLGEAKFVKQTVPNEQRAIRLAYAFTTHKLQGATVDNCYVALGDSMTDREMAYVQGSRHRDTLRLYATEFVAGEPLTRFIRAQESPQNQSAANYGHTTEALVSPLVKEMQRSRKQMLVHDLDFETPDQPPHVPRSKSPDRSL